MYTSPEFQGGREKGKEGREGETETEPVREREREGGKEGGTEERMRKHREQNGIGKDKRSDVCVYILGLKWKQYFLTMFKVSKKKKSFALGAVLGKFPCNNLISIKSISAVFMGKIAHNCVGVLPSPLPSFCEFEQAMLALSPSSSHVKMEMTSLLEGCDGSEIEILDKISWNGSMNHTALEAD